MKRGRMTNFLFNQQIPQQTLILYGEHPSFGSIYKKFDIFQRQDCHKIWLHYMRKYEYQQIFNLITDNKKDQMTVDWAFCRKVLGDDGYWFPCTALIISHNNKTYCALVYGLGKRRMIVQEMEGKSISKYQEGLDKHQERQLMYQKLNINEDGDRITWDTLDYDEENKQYRYVEEIIELKDYIFDEHPVKVYKIKYTDQDDIQIVNQSDYSIQDIDSKLVRLSKEELDEISFVYGDYFENNKYIILDEPILFNNYLITSIQKQIDINNPIYICSYYQKRFNNEDMMYVYIMQSNDQDYIVVGWQNNVFTYLVDGISQATELDIKYDGLCIEWKTPSKRQFIKFKDENGESFTFGTKDEYEQCEQGGPAKQYEEVQSEQGGPQRVVSDQDSDSEFDQLKLKYEKLMEDFKIQQIKIDKLETKLNNIKEIVSSQ